MCKTKLYCLFLSYHKAWFFLGDRGELFTGWGWGRGEEEGISRNKSALKENREEKSDTFKDDSFI